MKTLKIITLLLIVLALSQTANAQIEMNSSGKVGVAGAVPNSYYGLRVNGRLYLEGSSRYIYAGNVYASGIGTSGSTLSGSSLKLYGNSGETTFNTALTSPQQGVLAVNGVVVQLSDEKIKKDKSKIEKASDLIKSLSAYSYYYKSSEELQQIDFGGKYKYKYDTMLVDGEEIVIDESKNKFRLPKGQQFGFMAQDVSKTIPQLVSYDSANGVYGVNYIGIIPILVESNKELIANQEQLEARISELEKEVEKLVKKEKDNSSSARMVESDDASGATLVSELFQNAPNPFNESTEIRFKLSNDIADARLIVYNMQGRQVKSYTLSERGETSLIVRSGEFPAGMYMYTLIADGAEIGTKKMILTD